MEMYSICVFARITHIVQCPSLAALMNGSSSNSNSNASEEARGPAATDARKVYHCEIALPTARATLPPPLELES